MPLLDYLALPDRGVPRLLAYLHTSDVAVMCRGWPVPITPGAAFASLGRPPPPPDVAANPASAMISKVRGSPAVKNLSFTLCVRLLPGSTISSGKRRVLLIPPLLERPGVSLACGPSPIGTGEWPELCIVLGTVCANIGPVGTLPDVTLEGDFVGLRISYSLHERSPVCGICSDPLG